MDKRHQTRLPLLCSLAFAILCAAANQREVVKQFVTQEKRVLNHSQYADFMRRLPHLGFEEKKTAKIVCQLSEQLEDVEYDLTWLKLNRSKEEDEFTNSQYVISLNDRVISRNPRYRVFQESHTKWNLMIDQLQDEDGEATYLCRASLRTNQPPSKLSNLSTLLSGTGGGARLNVLTQPRFIEGESSEPYSDASEYEPFSLLCSVYGSDKSFMSWQKSGSSDSLNGTVSMRSMIGRSPKNRHQRVWRSTLELQFNPFVREHAGVYLCTARNGIGTGVSYRMELGAVNCRELASKTAPSEPCDAPRYDPYKSLRAYGESISESTAVSTLKTTESTEKSEPGGEEGGEEEAETSFVFASSSSVGRSSLVGDPVSRVCVLFASAFGILLNG